MTTARHRLDRPAAPVAVTVPLVVAFVVLRWWDAAQRRLGNFVLAGSRYASAARVPRGLPVRTGNGYDGQFYYRLALDPFNLSRAAYGIRLDSMSRIERIGYPFLAWALAGGHHGAVPLTMVVVNVVAAGALALAGGLLATSAGRHALWGLVFPLYWGYLWTLGRDLSELTTAALVILAVAALVRRHPLWAGLAFLGAVLCKETAVLLVATLALTSLWLRWSGRTAGTLRPAEPAHQAQGALGVQAAQALRPQRSDLCWAIPLAGFALWELVLLLGTGKLPIFESGGQNLGPPLVGLYHGFDHYLSIFPSVASVLWLGELAVMMILIVATARRRAPAPLELQVIWAVSVVLGACAATGIWLGDVGFRSLDDIYLFSWVVLLFHRGRLTPGLVLCGGAWGVVFVELVRYV
jgi:hypothetical protein